MTTQNLTTIEKHLKRAGIAGNDATLRSLLANAIRGTSAYFGDEEAAILKAHFAKGYRGTAIEEFLHEALKSGEWVGIVADQRERNPLPKGRDEEWARVDRSTADNPYGWGRNSNVLRDYYDHNVPGKWNPYRQTYNLTEEQRLEAGAPDYRVRGCTHHDVLGKTRHPKVEHDPEEVQRAAVRVQAEKEEQSGYRP